jgi:hypothetical protein
MTPCPPRDHVFVRTDETKPYPGQRRWEYVRAVSTCTRCGHRSQSGWARHLKALKKDKH